MRCTLGRPFRRLRLLRYRREPLAASFISIVLNLFSRFDSNYYTYVLRPKRLCLPTNSIQIYEPCNDLGIIIQGSIGAIGVDFVLSTVLSYSKVLFPGATIVISTWDDEDKNSIEVLKSLGVTVLQSTQPRNPGYSNINLQIESTSKAAALLAGCGVKFLLKTRTDQRIYAPDVFPYLKAILRGFPSVSKYQNTRLIGVSLNTFANRPFGISDMFMFGDVRDMIDYWCVDHDPRTSGEVALELEKASSFAELSKARACEVYLMTQYLYKIKHRIQEWSVRASLECYRNYFCIIDARMIDLYWPKYTSREYRWDSYYASNEVPQIEMTFRDWLLSLY